MSIRQFEIEQPDLQAFLTHYPDGRWVLMFSDGIERSEGELREAIHRALGRDMDVEIIAAGRWEMAGRIADRYSVLLEQNDEYQLQNRYRQIEGMAALATPQIEEVTPLQITPKAA